jgi:hypothetical protein
VARYLLVKILLKTAELQAEAVEVQRKVLCPQLYLPRQRELR